MIRRPPRSTRTDTLFPYTTLFRSKGFVLKTQLDIKQAIEFSMANKGWFLYAHAEKLAESVRISMQELLPPGRKIAFTGDFSRKCEVLQSLDVLEEASVDDPVTAIAQITTLLDG